MRGYPEFNFPAFDAAAAALRAAGYNVWSPAEADRETDGFDPSKHPCDTPPHDLSHYMMRDLPAVCACEAVALLPGWAASKGCMIEVNVAAALGKRIEPIERFLEAGSDD